MPNDKVIASDQGFSAVDREMLGRVAKLIIGPDPENQLPAADDESILTDMLERALRFERQVRGGLASLDSLAREHHQVSADVLPDETLADMLDNQLELRSFLRSMMQIVAQSYYQDARVLTSLGMEARPPFPQGHHVEEGDWRLLDPVRKRAPFYRDVSSSDKNA